MKGNQVAHNEVNENNGGALIGTTSGTGATPIDSSAPTLVGLASTPPTGSEGSEGGFNNFGFNEGLLAPVTPNGYEFTISNGAVTGEQRAIGTQTFSLNLPTNATFAVNSTTNTVTETLTTTGSTEIIQFAQNPTNSALYNIASETETITNPTTTNANGTTDGYSFTIANGSVTGLQKVSSHTSYNGVVRTNTESQTLSPAATFTVNGTTITETSVQGNTIEIQKFVSSGTTGLYAVASESTTFVQPGSATTLLDVNPFNRDEFTITNGTVTQVQSVSPTGTLTTVTPNANTTFSQLATGFVQETVTNGTNSAYVVYYDGNSKGIYTDIAHGTGTTVDLVGLQTQLASAPFIQQVT
jgi:hypothetical protein